VAVVTEVSRSALEAVDGETPARRATSRIFAARPAAGAHGLPCTSSANLWFLPQALRDTYHMKQSHDLCHLSNNADP
jgi:hypothetical protein